MCEVVRLLKYINHLTVTTAIWWIAVVANTLLQLLVCAFNDAVH